MSRQFHSTESQYAEYAAGLVSAPGAVQSFTISCWFMPFSASDVCIVSICAPNVSGFRGFLLDYLGNSQGGKIRAAVCSDDGNYKQVLSTTGASIGAWHHACGTFFWNFGYTLDSYLDGGSKASDTGGGTNYNPTRTSIGTFYSSSSARVNYFNGLIAEVVIFKQYLSDAQVFQLSRGVSPFQCCTPVNIIAYWPLAGNASPERDLKLAGSAQYPISVYGGAIKGVHPLRLKYPSDLIKNVYPFPSAPAATARSFAVIVG